MPRRDGEVFFFGTAMAAISSKLRRACAGPTNLAGSRAYRGTGALTPALILRLAAAQTVVERGNARGPALYDAGDPPHRRPRLAGAAPPRIRQHRGKQRGLARRELARRLVARRPRRGFDADVADRPTFGGADIDFQD